jgi:hypothetical protein
MRIRNNSKGALEVCGVLIRPGSDEVVPGYVETPLIRAWLRARVLAAVADPELIPVPPAPEPEPEAPDASERRELFDVLASYGLRPGGRTSTERLRAMLAQAEQESASTIGYPEPDAQPEE